MWRRLLFGYDFFISYARIDASQYAAALAKSLGARNFQCFLDHSEFPAGPAFQRRLRQAVRNSSSLILICTEGASRSPHVRFEVETFASTRRQIIPITFGEAFPADAWPVVVGRDFAWVSEDISRVVAGEPTASVVDQVQRSLALTRREVTRFRVMSSTVVVLFILLILALYFWRNAVHQGTVALAGQLAANAQLVLTEKPATLELATLLAVESMRRAPSLENDIALRTPLRFLAILIQRSTFEQAVLAVRWTPDGQHLISASGPAVTVFDGHGERRVATFTHEEPINTIALSPDGTLLATAGEDNKVKLIAVPEWREVRALEHEGSVRAVAFSPDTRRIATASEDATARIWDVGSGQEVTQLPHPDWVEDVAFSPDGMYVATGGQDQKLRIWEASRGQLLATIPLSSARAYQDRQDRTPTMLTVTARTQTVVFSPDGQLVATGGLGQEIRVIEVGSWKIVKSLERTAPFISDLVFSRDGRWLVALSHRDAVVWDVNKGAVVAELRHGDLVFQADFSRDGQLLVTASQDMTARVWEADTWTEVRRMTHESRVRTVAFAPFDTVVATGGNDGVLGVWRVNDSNRRPTLRDDAVVRGAAVSPDGRFLAAGGHGVQIWQTDNWKVAHPRLSTEDDVRTITFSQDGRYIAAGGSRGNVQVWDAAHQWHSLFRAQHGDVVDTVALSNDGHYMASGSWDNTVKVWEIPSGRELMTLPEAEAVQALWFAPDGEHLLVASGKFTASIRGDTRLWKWRSGQVEKELENSVVVTAIGSTPDGRLVATGDITGWVTVWKSRTWQEISRIAAHEVVRTLSFSKDGERLATGGLSRVTGGTDGSAKVWEVGTGREIARITFPKLVLGVVFLSGTRQLAAATGRDVMISLLHPTDLISEACSRLTRNLSSAEWRQYLSSAQYRRTCPK